MQESILRLLVRMTAPALNNSPMSQHKQRIWYTFVFCCMVIFAISEAFEVSPVAFVGIVLALLVMVWWMYK